MKHVDRSPVIGSHKVSVANSVVASLGAFPLALLLAAAGGCARFTIEMPRQVTVELGEEAVISGALANGRTPVGGVEVVDGVLPPGLALEFTREASNFSIRGIPSQAGRYVVDIFAWTYGTNFPGDRAKARLCIDVAQ